MEFDLSNPKLFDPMNDVASLLPSETGLYMIIGRNIDCIMNLFSSAELPVVNGYPVLYIGISEKQGLRKRDYKNHFEGTARKSTLRKSLGSLHEWRDYRVYYKDGKYRFIDFCEEKLTICFALNILH